LRVYSAVEIGKPIRIGGVELEEKKKIAEAASHQLSLSNRNLLGVEGVQNLGSYDQEQIIMETSFGVLEVKGERLHIQQLNLDQGKVLIDGEIDSLIYSHNDPAKKGRGFLGKLIK
jgi:sporulation protein YabP